MTSTCATFIEPEGMPRCAAYHSTSGSYGEPASQVSLPPKTPTQNSQSFPHSSPKLPHSSRMFEVSGRFLLAVLSITRVHARQQISRPNVHGSRCTPSPAWWSPPSHSSGASIIECYWKPSKPSTTPGSKRSHKDRHSSNQNCWSSQFDSWSNLKHGEPSCPQPQQQSTASPSHYHHHLEAE